MVRNEVACTRGARRSRALEGTGFAALYILSTTAEVSLIKALNYKGACPGACSGMPRPVAPRWTGKLPGSFQGP